MQTVVLFLTERLCNSGTRGERLSDHYSMEHCENARWQAETRVPEVFFGCYFDCVCGVFLYHVNDLYVINATAYVSQLILSVVFFNPNYGNVEIFLLR